MPAKGQATSESAKQKLRVVALGRKLAGVTKQKIGDALRGRKRGRHSEETKRKIGNANRGRKHTDEHNRKIGAAHKGRKRTDSTKRKMSKAAKGRKWSHEQKERLSAARKGRPAPWVRARLLGTTRKMSPKARAAQARRNKARALPEHERKRRRKEIARHCQLMARYGLSAAEYDKLFEQQKGVCRICALPCSTGKRLAVDHDHETRKIRGLLCRRCNRGLGHFPSLYLLRRALAYLESV